MAEEDDGPIPLRFSWALLTHTGLLPTNTRPDYEDWVTDITRLIQIEVASQWSIGDAYIIGDMAFGSVFDPTQVFRNRNIKIKTIQNYAWVCRAIPHSERDPEVSFTHHSVVAKLPRHRRDHWLARVKRDDLSVEELEDLSAEERGAAEPRAPLADLTVHYNRALDAYKRLPPSPEKRTIRKALRDLEGGIRSFKEWMRGDR